MTSLTLIAPAKINLSLRVLEKREDSYHEIETLMVPLVLADEITLHHAHGIPSGTATLFCNDLSLPTDGKNLCIKAAQAFYRYTGIHESIGITLLKKIPHGAGLGGGSSDAAAVLRGMNTFFGETLCFEELHHLATTIGSDVPFFLDAKPRWCRSRGELLGETVSLPAWKLLLIKPPFPIAAAEAYGRLQAAGCRLQADRTLLDDIPIFNDLEAPVFDKYLQLPTLKAWLQARTEVLAAWMTGSGSTIVAALKNEGDQEGITKFKKRISAEFGSSFWIKETSLFL